MVTTSILCINISLSKISRIIKYYIKCLSDFYERFLNKEKYKYGNKLEFRHTKENFEEKDQELLNIISNGNLAYELIRPQNFYFKWYIKMISKKMVATLLRFMPVLILAFLLPEPFKMTLPYSISNFIIFVISLFLGLLLVSSLNLIVHILTMFTLDGKGSITMYGVVAETFMGSIVPLPFLPIWMQKIGNFLPFKYIGDFPFRIYSNSITLSYGYKLLIGSFIWIIIINLIGLFISKIALRKAVIQGG